MNRLTEKFWFLTAALGLLLAMSTLVAVAANHHFAEEYSVELEDTFEETEAVVHRKKRRRQPKQPSANFPISSLVHNLGIRRCCKFFKPDFERDHLNGKGSYLLT